MRLRPVENLVRQTGRTCVTFAQLPNKHFLIIAKTDSIREIKVTIDVGQYFAPGTPALARIDQYCQPHFTSTIKTEPAKIFWEVAEIRTLGYAVSKGEYSGGNTAVVAPIFIAQDEVCRHCFDWFHQPDGGQHIALAGEQVKSTARVINQAVGGQHRLNGAARAL